MSLKDYELSVNQTKLILEELVSDILYKFSFKQSSRDKQKTAEEELLWHIFACDERQFLSFGHF